MKTFLLLFLACLFTVAITPELSGQYKKPNRLFKKGDTDVLAGFGLLPTFLKDNISQVLPPLSLRFEKRLASNYSLGLEAAHSITNSNKEHLFSDERRYQNRYYYFALRNTVNCNCNNLKNWDIYGGFALGVNLIRISVINGDFGELEALYGIKPKRTQMTFHGYLGARFACSARLSFFGELGYGASIVQLGVGYKL